MESVLSWCRFLIEKLLHGLLVQQLTDRMVSPLAGDRNTEPRAHSDSASSWQQQVGTGGGWPVSARCSVCGAVSRQTKVIFKLEVFGTPFDSVHWYEVNLEISKLIETFHVGILNRLAILWWCFTAVTMPVRYVLDLLIVLLIPANSQCSWVNYIPTPHWSTLKHSLSISVIDYVGTMLWIMMRWEHLKYPCMLVNIIILKEVLMSLNYKVNVVFNFSILYFSFCPLKLKKNAGNEINAKLQSFFQLLVLNTKNGTNCWIDFQLTCTRYLVHQINVKMHNQNISDCSCADYCV
jgi:hypothetical protein